MGKSHCYLEEIMNNTLEVTFKDSYLEAERVKLEHLFVDQAT